MQDPLASSRRVRRARRTGRPWGREGRQAAGAAARVPYRRRLTAIERALTADEPALISKFAVFNRLVGGSRPAGAEPLPRGPWPRPWPAYLVVLLALAALAALCLTFSAQVPPPARPCQVPAANAPARDVPCHAYPTAKGQAGSGNGARSDG